MATSTRSKAMEQVVAEVLETGVPRRQWWLGRQTVKAPVAGAAAWLVSRTLTAPSREEWQVIPPERQGKEMTAEHPVEFLRVERGPVSLALGLARVLGTDGSPGWDAHLVGRVRVGDPIRFLRACGARLVSAGSPLTADLLASWIVRELGPAVRDWVRESAAGFTPEEFRDQDVLPASVWTSWCNERLAQAGLEVDWDAVEWENAEEARAAAERERARELERLEAARQREREAELRELQARTEAERKRREIELTHAERLRQLENDSALSESARRHQRQMLELEQSLRLEQAKAELERQRLQWEAEIQAARREAEQAAWQHALTKADYEHRLAEARAKVAKTMVNADQTLEVSRMELEERRQASRLRLEALRKEHELRLRQMENESGAQEQALKVEQQRLALEMERLQVEHRRVLAEMTETGPRPSAAAGPVPPPAPSMRECAICHRFREEPDGFHCPRCRRFVCQTHKDPEWLLCEQCAWIERRTKYLGGLVCQFQHCGRSVPPGEAFVCRRCQRWLCRAHADPEFTDLCQDCGEACRAEAVAQAAKTAGTGTSDESLAALWAALRQPNPPFQARIWPQAPGARLTRDVATLPRANHARFRVGDAFALWAQADRDCHLTLVDVGTSGKVMLLLADHPIPNGQSVLLGGPDEDRQWRIGPPAGVEHIHAWFTRTPVRLFDATDAPVLLGDLREEQRLRARLDAAVARLRREPLPAWVDASFEFVVEG